jgi:hypothetical protein
MSSPSEEKDVREVLAALAKYNVETADQFNAMMAKYIGRMTAAEQRATKLAEEVERLTRRADFEGSAHDACSSDALRLKLQLLRIADRLGVPPAWSETEKLEHIERFAEAAEAQLAGLVEALRKIADGDEPRPVGRVFRADSASSKNDRCIHDVVMYETCGECIADVARQALASLTEDAE